VQCHRNLIPDGAINTVSAATIIAVIMAAVRAAVKAVIEGYAGSADVPADL